MANLGFIGLGTMGGKMVRRLLNAGHTVTGYNRTKSRGDWLVDLGMLWGDTPRARSRGRRRYFHHGRQHPGTWKPSPAGRMECWLRWGQRRSIST